MERYPEPNMEKRAGVLDRRAEALLVDTFLVVGVLGGLGYLAGAVLTDVPYGGGAMTIVALQFVAPFLLLGYQVGLEGYYGQTVGKWSRGIVVVSDDGSPVSWGGAILRNVLRIVDGLPILYLLGIVVAYVTDEHQRVGDLAGSTVVVHAQD